MNQDPDHLGAVVEWDLGRSVVMNKVAAHRHDVRHQLLVVVAEVPMLKMFDPPQLPADVSCEGFGVQGLPQIVF